MPIPLEIRISPLPTRGGDELVRVLFEPLGWTVAAERIDGPNGPSRYVSLTLLGVQRVADALAHLYVLIPVLDDEKHYWVGDDEVEKLLAKGGEWLGGHPAKDLIARRYLKHRRNLARVALARLAPEEAEAPQEQGAHRDAAGEALEAPMRLNDQRMEAVIEALANAGAKVVADLGCGEGKLLGRLVRDRRFARIFGLDASARALERAADRLKLNLAGGPPADRVKLLHGALTYRDERWKEADAAVLVEVIEHLELDRLPALASVVFGAARPKTVIVTTPNAEHNALFANLPAGKVRHPDHRFEWTRAEFRSWAAKIEVRFGYAATLSEIGAPHHVHGAPTQMAVFRTDQGSIGGAA
jgi:3' terminal RNA ribose 2'-O-methyltransferase Hen1